MNICTSLPEKPQIFTFDGILFEGEGIYKPVDYALNLVRLILVGNEISEPIVLYFNGKTKKLEIAESHWKAYYFTKTDEQLLIQLIL